MRPEIFGGSRSLISGNLTESDVIGGKLFGGGHHPVSRSGESGVDLKQNNMRTCGHPPKKRTKTYNTFPCLTSYV